MNLEILGDGHIKLVDFGLAKGMESGDHSLNYSVVGTAEYMAPEVEAMCGHSQAADWWSFGIFAHELFFNCTPTVSHFLTSAQSVVLVDSFLLFICMSLLYISPFFLGPVKC